MWIDLYIDGFLVKSWLVEDLPALEFSQEAHLRRAAWWDEKLTSCKSEAAITLCLCRQYVFCVRVKSGADCQLGAEGHKKEQIGFERWQIKFITGNAGTLTIKNMCQATGLKCQQVWGILYRNNLQPKRVYRKRTPYKISPQ